MTHAVSEAERCLVAACVFLSLSAPRDPDFGFWLSVLDDALTACTGSRAPGLLDLRAAGSSVVRAEDGKSRETALWHLQMATRRYYARIAAERHQELRRRVG